MAPRLGAAAAADADELAQMRAQAARDGVVPVLVHLQSSTLAQLRSAPGPLRGAADAKAGRLIAELGYDVLAAGRWSNGAGQIGLHVTAHGLDVLLGTANAISFSPGAPWQQRTLLNGTDGSHAAIEQALRERGAVDVEVLLNADGLEVGYGPRGKADFQGAAHALRAAGRHVAEIARTARHGAFADQGGVAQAAAQAASPLIAMRVTREGMLALADSDAVRSIRPVGHVDARPLEIDPQAIEQARMQGEADVIVVLRDWYNGGRLTPASLRATKRANRAALDAILVHARPGVVKADYAEFGAVAAGLTAQELATLAQVKDPRLLAVTLNKPVAEPQLANSAVTMNMGSAWNAGFTASGQGVIVVDSGVEAGHAFFGGRVVYQGCFGTAGSINGDTWVSPCPGGSAATAWDSPAGTPNAAAPVAGSSHGTHVAGIAVGNRVAPSVLRGTGPSASIYAIQVFSQKQGTTEISAFRQDTLAALRAAADALPALSDGRAQPFSVNMSLGGEWHPGPCTSGAYAPFVTAVAQLRAAGVPVIAATGNNGFQDAINFPACLPGTIKVSSVANDGIGNTRSVFNSTQAANVVDPASFPQETFWLAPGGGNGTSVLSSVTRNSYNRMQGTSMATPQIAGLYASVKGAAPTLGVEGVTEWLRANASQLVPITVTSGGVARQVQWRRPRLPAL